MLQEKGNIGLSKEKFLFPFFFFFLPPPLDSATKPLVTNTRVVWLLAFVGLELKVQAGRGSLPVFQHLPIYFGKKALVLRTGLQTALGYKQESTDLRALSEETNN